MNKKNRGTDKRKHAGIRRFLAKATKYDTACSIMVAERRTETKALRSYPAHAYLECSRATQSFCVHKY